MRVTEWVRKRFWKQVRTEPVGEGCRVLLDGRGIRTPAGRPLVLPTRALAGVVAEEWEAQETAVDPTTMPFTRMANSALDKVAPQRDAVRRMLGGYGETDLLSYRADTPVELAARQAEFWDPVLEWASERFGGRLRVTQGVMPVAQPDDAVAGLAAPLHEMPSFPLAAFHDMVVLTGSIVLAHAIASDRLDGGEAWALSRLDEEWQAAEWGLDHEAEIAAEAKRRDLLDAERFWALSA